MPINLYRSCPLSASPTRQTDRHGSVEVQKWSSTKNATPILNVECCQVKLTFSDWNRNSLGEAEESFLHNGKDHQAQVAEWRHKRNENYMLSFWWPRGKFMNIVDFICKSEAKKWYLIGIKSVLPSTTNDEDFLRATTANAITSLIFRGHRP